MECEELNLVMLNLITHGAALLQLELNPVMLSLIMLNLELLCSSWDGGQSSIHPHHPLGLKTLIKDPLLLST